MEAGFEPGATWLSPFCCATSQKLKCDGPLTLYSLPSKKAGWLYAQSVVWQELSIFSPADSELVIGNLGSHYTGVLLPLKPGS